MGACHRQHAWPHASALDACADHASRVNQKLLRVSKYEREKEARRLIARGAPIDWQGSGGDGQAPLHWASISYAPGIMMLLVRHKANLNITNASGNTPLAYAAQKNRWGGVRKLVVPLRSYNPQQRG